MKTSIISLEIQNIKGVKQLTLTPDGQSIAIFGNNALGKTTAGDSVFWLLFDKDLNFNTKFDLKTLDESGKQIHNLDHAVTGVFDNDGTTITLKKTLTEKWTRPRGKAQQEFDGHTTKYEIDGVPATLAKFKAAVAAIADEEVFKLLSSPYYFASKLPWQDRRRIMLSICGDVSDADVIASRPDILSDLPTILGKRSAADHKATIKAEQVKINGELEAIPIKIKEVRHNLPDISTLNRAELISSLKQVEDEKTALETQKTQAENGTAIVEKKKTLAETETAIAKINNDFAKTVAEILAEKRKELGSLDRGKINIESDITVATTNLATKRYAVEASEKRMAELREEWTRVNETPHEPVPCPHCGADIHSLDHEEKKRARLAEINANGKKEKEAAEAGKLLVAEAETLIADLKKGVDEKQAEITAMEAEIKRIEGSTCQDASLNGLLATKDTLNREIVSLSADSGPEIERITSEIEAKREEISSIEADIKKFADIDAGEKRVKELADDEKRLATEFERLEKEIFLIDSFTRAKVDLLESKINSKFKLAQFKMFNEQINGSLAECCEVIYNGVPFNSGLNHGAQIMVGCDIIETLSSHYGKHLPCIIDNAEAVTARPTITDTQIIRLVVNEKDKTLRVEKE